MIPAPKSPIGPDWKAATRMCVFFCWGDSLFSREISHITNGPSHMGIGFGLSDASEEFYENRFAEGFKGPKSMESLRAWARENPNRRVEIYWLDLSAAISERKHVVAHTWVGLVGYAEWKLLSFLWFEKMGIHIRSSWNRWVCSTSVATILHAECCLQTQNRSIAEVTPKSARDAVLQKILWTVREVLGGKTGVFERHKGAWSWVMKLPSGN